MSEPTVIPGQVARPIVLGGPTAVRPRAAKAEQRTELSDADEKLLAERFARAEAAVFDEVVTRYQSRVARLAYRLLGWRGGDDVDDVVQDVFLSALRHCRRFRSESGLWTWLTRVTVNACRTRRRRRLVRWRFFANGKHPSDRSALQPASDQKLLDDETSSRVRAAVQALPPRDREVIVLHYFEHLTVAGISEAIGASSNAIQVRLHRARVKLASQLSDLMESGA